MKAVSISSGSKGNCIYIESGNTCILIDNGLSLKNLESKLAILNIDPNKIGTHINGVPVYDITSLKTTFPSGCNIAILAIPKENIDDEICFYCHKNTKIV